MKKLTAGIFATLLAVVSADGAYAAIASKGYVDDKVGTVEATVATKADKSALDTLSGTVTGHTTQIGTINTKIGGYGDIVTHDASEFATAAQGTKADTAVQPADITNVERTTNKTQTVNAQSTETQYPSAKAVWTAVSSVDANASVEALEGRVGKLETASATHATKTELTDGLKTKQDKLTQTGSASQPVYVDSTGKVTAGNTIPTVTTTIAAGQTDAAQAGAVATALAAKANSADLGALAKLNSVGSAQITDGAVATTDIASKAVTKEKLADAIVTSLGKADSALQQGALADYVTKEAADAAYADIATEGVASTASTNAQTALKNIGTLTDLTTDAKTNTVAAINEVASEAAAAATAAAGAKTAADTAQGDVNALEAVVNHETTGLAAAHTAIDAVEGRVTTAEGEIDTIQTTISKMATSEAVTSLTNRVTTAEGDIDDLEAAVNDAESGLAATNAIADSALSTAQSAQTTANAALPKATYNSEVGTVSATNMGTSASTVVTAIKEVAGEASAAQTTATAAQKTANAAIPAPTAACAEPENKCVLVSSGAGNYSWEVIARNGEGQ